MARGPPNGQLQGSASWLPLAPGVALYGDKRAAPADEIPAPPDMQLHAGPFFLPAPCKAWPTMLVLSKGQAVSSAHLPAPGP